jgi:hypothetical protein
MGRAYSPLLLRHFWAPGALPQAGMECAFGASHVYKGDDSDKEQQFLGNNSF